MHRRKKQDKNKEVDLFEDRVVSINRVSKLLKVVETFVLQL